jgi:hypothetical protein
MLNIMIPTLQITIPVPQAPIRPIHHLTPFRLPNLIEHIALGRKEAEHIWQRTLWIPNIGSLDSNSPCWRTAMFGRSVHDFTVEASFEKLEIDGIRLCVILICGL